MGIYEDEGWEAIVLNPSPDGKRHIEVYIIALADREAAEKKIRTLLAPSAVIKEFVKIAPSEMRRHQLYHGRWAKIPIK